MDWLVAAMHKVWEVALLAIVVSVAAKVVLSVVVPLIPAILVIAFVLFIIGGIFNKKRML